MAGEKRGESRDPGQVRAWRAMGSCGSKSSIEEAGCGASGSWFSCSWIERLDSFRVLTVFAVIVWLIGSTFVVLSSGYGRRAISSIRSIDWAHHLALAETLYSEGRIDPQDTRQNLMEMSFYPSWSHRSVALVGRALGRSPVEAIQIWCGWLTVAGAILLGLRVMLQFRSPGHILGLILATLLLFAEYRSGLYLAGHIYYNFFFAQLFGTILAIALFTAIQTKCVPARYQGLVIIVFGALVLPNFHLAPAIWFIVAATLLLWLRHDTLISALPSTFVLIALAGVALLVNPAVRDMLRIVQSSGGEFDLRGVLLESRSAVLGLFCAGGILSCVLLYIRKAQSELSWRLVLADHSGLLAVYILTGAQMLSMAFLAKGSTYSLTKYLYLLAVEVPILVAGLRLPKGLAAESAIKGGGWSLVLAAGFIQVFALEDPLPIYTADQTALIVTRQSLLRGREKLTVGERRYPQFSWLSPLQRYYLAIGVLRLPRDTRTMSWFLQNGGEGEQSLPYDALGLPNGFYVDQISAVAGMSGRLPAGGQRLNLQIMLPNDNYYNFAKRLPAVSGEVVLGYRLFTERRKMLLEGRSALERTGPGVYSSTIELQPVLRAAGPTCIEVGVVHEWITWFPSWFYADLGIGAGEGVRPRVTPCP